MLVRTSAGAAFLPEPVYGASCRSLHNRKMLCQFVEEDDSGVPQDLEKLLSRNATSTGPRPRMSSSRTGEGIPA